MTSLLQISEAAKRLGICNKTLREHIKNGHIPYISIGFGKTRQKKLIDETDLEAFKEKSRRISIPCQSTNAAQRSTMTSSSQTIDFMEIREQRRNEKRNGLRPRENKKPLKK